MRRNGIGLLAGAAVVLALLGAPLASHADFHPACAGIVTGDAQINLSAADGGSFTYEERVTCPGAQKIVADVALERITPFGAEPVDAVSTSCDGVPACLDPVVASNTLALTDGTYQVSMLFDVEGAGGVFTFARVPRCGIWTVTGGSASGPAICPQAYA